MALITEIDLPQLDVTDPSLRGPRVHEVLDGLRERSWLAASPLGFAVLEREAGELFLRSRATAFPMREIVELFGIAEGPLRTEMTHNIIGLEGADHGRLRRLVNPAFTPRAADRVRPAMRGFLAELVAGIAREGSCDFVSGFAQRYPSLVIAHVMGAPREDAARLHRWSNLIQRQFDAASLMAERDLVEGAVEEFYAYCHELLRARRGDPGEDLLSTLLAAEAEGDRLSETECVNLVLNVLIGGVDTTQSQLAHTIRLFAAHPDQWELLAERPSELAPRAVEESLRHEPITPFTARVVREEVEHRGVTFPPGTLVLVCSLTANHESGREFDITAQRDGSRVLTFGAGPHYCLGANLARAELEEALTFLAPRLRGLALDGEAEYESMLGIHGLSRLPVRFEPFDPGD